MKRTRRFTPLLPLLMLLATATPTVAEAHSLGIDKADLNDLGDGNYELVSKVPPRLQPAIVAPILPDHCTLSGNPRGERGSYSVRFQFACDGALTANHSLSLPWQREGVMLTVKWRGEEPVTRLSGRSGAVIPVSLAEYHAGSGSFRAAATRYTRLGIEHILEGLDHLLFVLALLFVVRGGWQLVKTVTAFTVAHSITLGLATLGFINLPGAPVEAAIALSIVFLCIEILKHDVHRPGLTFTRPWLVAFAFGLLHGLGFAGALAAIGLPPAEIPLALLFFNVGVEIGQLLFIAGVFAILWPLRHLLEEQRSVNWTPLARTAAVYGIGTLATYWLIERAAPIFGIA